MTVRADASNAERIRGKFASAASLIFRFAFAAFQSASISASVASDGVLPLAARAVSIAPKRRSNFRLVERNAVSGSTSR